MNARKILIVEDEPIVRLHLQRIVADAGHALCGAAANAEQAFAIADREPPELVLMDIQLPGELDGVDAARALRERHDCEVVFATAYADDRTVVRTETVGAAAYVAKPFTNAEVSAAIRTAFAGRERIDRIRASERSLASILGSIGESILVTDAGGKVSFANPPAARLTGWQRTDAGERDILEVLNVAAAAEAQSLDEACSRVLAGGGKQSLAGIEIVTPDGDERSVDVDVNPAVESGAADAGLIIVVKERVSRLRGSATVAQPRAEGGTRLLMYSHDTFGLGHLQRSLNLMRALLARCPEISILLVTGSPVVHRFKFPKGADYVKLPAVRKVGSERYEARSLSLSDAGVRNLRSNLLLRTVRDYRPDFLIVDHAPVGMGGEVLPTLEWLRDRGECCTLLGLRDIIDEPRSVMDLWNEKGIYTVLQDLYDHVLVYGNRTIYNPVAAYGFPPEVAAKTFFTNYVCERNGSTSPRRRADERLVVVSIGGGDGGAEEVIGNYLEMLRRFRGEIDFRTRVLTGPLLPPEAQQRFRALARDLPVEVQEFAESTTPLFERADLVVSTAGYNTATQLFAHARRSIIIPRVLHRHEQLIRARRMDELGLATCLHPRSADPETIFAAVRAALANPEEPLTRSRAQAVVPLDGAERAAEFLHRLQRDRSANTQESL